VLALSIMQGRLLAPVDGRLQAFPGSGWEVEFELAAELGLSGIELIAEAHARALNPLFDRKSAGLLRDAIERTGVAARSVCGDCVIERSAKRNGFHLSGLIEELIGSCASVGAERLVVPLVDDARLRNSEDVDRAVGALLGAGRAAGRRGIELHLETDLEPDPFAALLERLPAEVFWVNYDTGNSASLGYDPREEFAAYGARVGSVHVKDRVRGGVSVPLGTGDAELASVFELLNEARYEGDLVLQTARGTDSQEVAWTREAIKLIRDLEAGAGG
jgi:L-ribulose-5-phosphate 3-epimerase